MPKKIKVKAKKPQNLDTAIQHYQSGELKEAEMICRQILNQHPNNSEAWYILGLIAYKFMQHDSAISNIERAIREDPRNCIYHYALGKFFMNKGMWDEAIEKFRNTLSLKPDYGETYNNIGIALAEKGMLDEAVESFRKAIEIDPNDAEAANNLGNSFLEKGLTDEAIDNYRRAIELKPEFASAYDNLGNALSEKGMIDEAIESYGKALLLDPDDAGIYNNLGTVLEDINLLDEAIENYRKALLLKPDCAEAYNNMGNAFKDKGRMDDAIESYKRALDLNPDNAETLKNLGMVYLLAKNFERGWQEYEGRLSVKDNPLRPFPQPCWDGSHLKGRTLLIYAEQGVGDEIMFASCLPDVISQGGQCVIECDRRLMPLFNRSFPEVMVIRRLSVDDPDQSHLPQADIKIAIGSLPLFFRPDLDSFPQQESYLKPDKEKVEIWRARFKELGEGLKVGISWRGGKEPRVKLTRSIALERCKLFYMSGIHFINLQYGDCAEELKDLKETQDVTIHDWDDADPIKNLDNFAAQIAALDLVISVDNSTVHMAGALGVPVWALLPFACDWRWMQDFEDTPWYKSVRLFRQRTLGEWDGVLERVSSDFREFVATGVMPEIDFRHSYKKTG